MRSGKLESKDEKKPSFDAGPLLILDKRVTLDHLRNCVISEKAIKYLITTIQDNPEYQRFAIYQHIDAPSGSSYLFYRPSLSSKFEGHPEKVKPYEAIYGKGSMVIASPVLSGVVHEKTRDLERQEAIEEKNYELAYLLEKKPPLHMGLSCEYVNGLFEFLNRSRMVMSLQKINTVSKAALFFSLSQPYDEKENKFYRKKYTLEYHISRSVTQEMVDIIMDVTTKKINEYIVKHGLDIPCKESWGYLSKDCTSFEMNALWEKELRYNKENLAESFLRNMYIAAGFLDDEKPEKFWTPLTDEAIICYIIQTAKRNNIILNVNKIPDAFKNSKEYHFSSTLLMFAARRKFSSLIREIVQLGADLNLRDEKGHDAIWYAKNSKQSGNVYYLEATKALYQCMTSPKHPDKVQQVAAALQENKYAINLYKPFYCGTPLIVCAADEDDSQLLNEVISFLFSEQIYAEENRFIDEPQISSGKTALFMAVSKDNLQNVKTLLAAGANPALVLEHKEYSTLTVDPQIHSLLTHVYYEENDFNQRAYLDEKEMTNVSLETYQKLFDKIKKVKDKVPSYMLLEEKIAFVENLLAKKAKTGKSTYDRLFFGNLFVIMRCLLLQPRSRTLDSLIKESLAMLPLLLKLQNQLRFTLLSICLENESSYVKDLIAAGAMINHQTQTGDTLLMQAVSKQKPALIAALLEAKADVNVKNIYQETALVQAIKFHTDNIDDDFAVISDNILETLLEAKANPMIKNGVGLTALNLAIRFCKTSCVELLESYVTKRDMLDALLMEIQNNKEIVSSYTDILERIVNCLDGSGNTALHAMIKLNNPAMVEILINHRANIDIPNAQGKSPCLLAIKTDNPDILSLLIKEQPELKDKGDDKGSAPIFIAAEINKTEIFHFLLEQKLDLNIKDPFGQSLAHVVIKKQNGEMLDLLIKHKADLNQPDKKGRTPMMIALERYDFLTVDRLLEEKVDVSIESMSIQMIAFLNLRLLKKIIQTDYDGDKPVHPLIHTHYNFIYACEYKNNRNSWDDVYRELMNALHTKISTVPFFTSKGAKKDDESFEDLQSYLKLFSSYKMGLKEKQSPMERFATLYGTLSKVMSRLSYAVKRPIK